jgi:hypothetical protein
VKDKAHKLSQDGHLAFRCRNYRLGTGGCKAKLLLTREGNFIAVTGEHADEAHPMEVDFRLIEIKCLGLLYTNPEVSKRESVT